MSDADGGGDLNGGKLQDFTIDQLAGATALVLGSIGALLMIIWKSRCSCRVRLGLSDKCYIFDCSREPPKHGGDSDDEIPIKPNKVVGAEGEGEVVVEVDRNSQELAAAAAAALMLAPEPEPAPQA